jgi:PAS domain S-box-containing protein
MPSEKSLDGPAKPPAGLINIALVGGSDLCLELLEKMTFDHEVSEINSRILAVADEDSQAPGVRLARELGLETVDDYHLLYRPALDLHLIILLVDDDRILTDILNSRPQRIRILSYGVFKLFWQTIGREERKLRRRNEEVETILNGIQDFIVVITPDRRIADANEAFLTKMRYAREEVVGRRCHEVFQQGSPPCLNGGITCPLNEIVRNRRPCIQMLSRRNRKGEQRHFEVAVFPIWEKDGKISKFIEISRDVTKRKQEEDEITGRLEQMVEERTRQLKETHSILLHQDKMASLGKLSASVVHEINNPIAGILNLVMLIKRIIDEGPPTSDEITRFAQYLDLMETETRRVSRIVSNLLAFSRNSKMEIERVRLNRLIEKTLILTDNLLKISGVGVETGLDQGLPALQGSEDQLLQVFMNLVANAVEAMESGGGGRLEIRSEYDMQAGRVVVTFRDTGIGIPPDKISQVFDPFFTTKSKGKGVGLGLSVAYGIIEKHGGRIRVTSEVGKGSTFAVELPLNPAGRLSSRPGDPHGQHQDSDR